MRKNVAEAPELVLTEALEVRRLLSAAIDFPAPLVTVGARLSALAAADFNGDDRADIAGVGNGSLSVVLSGADGRFAAPRVWSVNGADLDAADVDGDHDLDLLLAVLPDQLQVMKNDGAGGSGRRQPSPPRAAAARHKSARLWRPM